MKKFIGRFWQGIFRRLFLAITGLFVVTISILMLLFLRNIAEKTREEEVRILENKLYMVASDMDKQIDKMQTLVLKLANQKKLYPNYMNDNKFLEKEAVDLLVSSYAVTSIENKFFLIYEDYDMILTSDGTTLSSVNYLSNKYSLEKESVVVLTEQLSGGKTREFRVYHEKDLTLILFSLQAYNTAGKLRGTVCFVLPASQMKKRIDELVGSIESPLSIYYDDVCLYEGNEEGVVEKADEKYFFSQSENHIRVYAQIDEKDYFSLKNIFSETDIIVFLILLITLLCSCYMVARRSYNPIYQILNKYFLTENSTFAQSLHSVTWNDIDSMIEMLLYEKEKNIEQLEVQIRTLREQAVWLVVTGGYSSNMQNRLALLNIKMNYPVFGIIESDLKRDSISNEAYTILQENIEELSEKDIQLYTYWNEFGNMDILALSEEEYHIDEIVELLYSIFEINDKRIELKTRIKCRDLESIRNLYQKNSGVKKRGAQEVRDVKEGQEGHETQKTPESPEKIEGGKNMGKSQRTVKQVIEYINNNCCDYDLSLEKVASEFQITTPYLCTILKQEIGMSYKEYLTKLRINEAAKLLREEDISVADVCRRVGYVNVSYFIKLFQKHTGTTPNNYRSEYNGKEVENNQ